MTSQPCWRCVLQIGSTLNGCTIRQPRAAILSATCAFSTSLPRTLSSKAAPKLGKKKVDRKTAKPPAPGERRALKKMIVLSNTNAFPVPEINEMTAENVSSVEHRGTVLSIPDAIVSRLRAAEIFQTKQRWKMFRKPSIVLRSADLRLAQMMDDVKDSKTAIRQVVVGERGAGKSLYLLQAAASAMLKDWIVITIPEAQDLINANTAYGPIQGVRPIMYQQKVYTASLLERIVAVNPQLADLKTTMDHQLSVTIPKSLPLSKLADLGISDPTLVQAIFEALMRELTAPGRPPLLITLDGFNHINKISAYRSASFQLIHAHDIFLPHWFTSLLSGRSPLLNGGAVLAAMTCSNGPHIQTLDDRLEHLEKQQSMLNGKLELKAEDSIILPYLKATGQTELATQIPELDPFIRYDPRVLDIFAQTASTTTNNNHTSPNKSLPPGSTAPAAPTAPTTSSWSSMTPAASTVEVKRLTGLTKMEAKALMEYWALSGILRAEVSERFVGEVWAVAGGGLPGEMERSCLGLRF